MALQRAIFSRLGGGQKHGPHGRGAVEVGRTLVIPSGKLA